MIVRTQLFTPRIKVELLTLWYDSQNSAVHTTHQSGAAHSLVCPFGIQHIAAAECYSRKAQFYPQDGNDLINRFEHCIAEVKAWMKVNKLKLNDEKTEVILLGNNNITKYVPSPSLHINDISLEATDKVKNLGVTIDKNLSLSFFISSLCKNSYVQLRKIASIRHCLTTEVTKTLVTSLVLSRLDYCNAVLAGTSKKFLSRLQVVQNNAARLILKKEKFNQCDSPPEGVALVTYCSTN